MISDIGLIAGKAAFGVSDLPSANNLCKQFGSRAWIETVVIYIQGFFLQLWEGALGPFRFGKVAC